MNAVGGGVVADAQSQPGGPAISDAVQACMRMTAAGIAIAVLPYALAAGVVVGYGGLYGDRMLGDDDLTGTARILLMCTLVAGAGVVARGIRAAWTVRDMRGGGPRPRTRPALTRRGRRVHPERMSIRESAREMVTSSHRARHRSASPARGLACL